MSFAETILIAVALGADAFSVAVGVGTRGASGRQLFRLSFHFGLFQFLMPIIGWVLGHNIVRYVSGWDHWIAFGLLFAIGAKMLWESLHHGEEERASRDRTRGWSLVALSLATSIDALAVGVSFGILRQSFLLPCVIIGVVAAAMTLVGMKLGERLSAAFGRHVETAGALVLIALAFKMLFSM